jgi:hypothetical protein
MLNVARPMSGLCWARLWGATITEFKIGQYVYYIPRKAEGRYVVMRLLPRGTKGGGPLYIIRSQDNPEREYTAEASELRRVPSGR